MMAIELLLSLSASTFVKSCRSTSFDKLTIFNNSNHPVSSNLKKIIVELLHAHSVSPSAASTVPTPMKERQIQPSIDVVHNEKVSPESPMFLTAHLMS